MIRELLPTGQEPLDSLESPPIIEPVVQRVTSPVFIGRGTETDQLSDALGRAAAGIPSTVLVGGEAGIGKSRLLGELTARARARGMLVLEGGCVTLGTDEGLPFAPIAAALRALVRELDGEVLAGMLDESTAELARLVTDLGGTPDESPWLNARPDWAQTPGRGLGRARARRACLARFRPASARQAPILGQILMGGTLGTVGDALGGDPGW